MVISKDSWHFRLLHTMGALNYWDEHDGINLCPYVQRLFFVVGLMIPGGLVVSGLILFLMFEPFLGWISTYNVHVPVGISMVAWVMLGGLLLGSYHQEYEKGRGYHKDIKLVDVVEIAEKFSEREPGIISLWWQATHGKICPRVEFKD